MAVEFERKQFNIVQQNLPDDKQLTLEEANQQGIQPSDVKPTEILYSDDGNVYQNVTTQDNSTSYVVNPEATNHYQLAIKEAQEAEAPEAEAPKPLNLFSVPRDANTDLLRRPINPSNSTEFETSNKLLIPPRTIKQYDGNGFTMNDPVTLEGPSYPYGDSLARRGFVNEDGSREEVILLQNDPNARLPPTTEVGLPNPPSQNLGIPDPITPLPRFSELKPGSLNDPTNSSNYENKDRRAYGPYQTADAPIPPMDTKPPEDTKPWTDWFIDNSSTILTVGGVLAALGAAGYAAYQLFDPMSEDDLEEKLEESIDSGNYLYLYEPKIIVAEA